MRIVQITPGSGNSFYCENCLRDAALITTMQKLGHDVLMVPLYLPVRGDRGQAISDTPIFFGGLNVYLQQKSALFRKTPRWIDRLFDSPRLLDWVGRKAGMTSARDLGETTISMLRAEQGRQIKELDRLVEWLSTQGNRPDVVCLSNILLSGLARRIKAKLGVPVLCLLQDEDGFLDGLASPYAKQAWEIVGQRCGDVDAFVAVSGSYADVMQRRLRLPAERVHVAYTGISLDGYKRREARLERPTIGYLSKMCFDKGLDTLAEAFISLKKNEKLKGARLRIAGGKSANDEPFINQVRERLSSCGLMDDVEFLEDFDLDSRLAFFQTLTVLSVPEKRPVASVLYVLEALAAVVHFVQPASGVFVELLEITGGGVLYEPNNAEALASAMEPLLLETDNARELGERGREVVFEKFNVEQTAEEMVRIYEVVVRHFSRE